MRTFISTLILCIFLSYSLLTGDLLYAFVVFSLIIMQLVLSSLKLFHPIFLFLFPFLALFYLTGDLLGFYDSGSEYDSILHFISGFITSLLFGSMVFKILRSKSKKNIYILILVFGLFLGTGWEYFEILAGQYVPQDLVGDTNDTTLDLFMDTLGTILAIFTLKQFPKHFRK